MTAATRLYVRTQNETASREQLMVLLFEAALRHIRQGSVALERRQFRQAAPSLARASDIVTELLNTLDHNKAPDLCDKLTRLYLFVVDRLVKATLDRDPHPARDAERVLAPIAEGFSQAVKAVDGTRPGAAAR